MGTDQCVNGGKKMTAVSGDDTADRNWEEHMDKKQAYKMNKPEHDKTGWRW